MDIQRQVKPKPKWQKYWYLLPLGLIATLAVAANRFLGDTSFVVEKESLQFATVEKGEFKVEVRGVGQLKPANIYWVSTQANGRVEQILVKPGSVIKKGELLVKLSNPELQRELETIDWELQAVKAEMQASMVLLESQLVELESGVDEAEFNYQSAKLKLDAEKSLMNQGGGSISKIDFERTQLSVKQQKHRWLAQKRRAAKMHENIEASKTAQLARTELIQKRYQRAKEMTENLQVKAHTNGTVQEVELVLGQQVSLGSSVAKIANNQDLYAELLIQELQIKDIEIGQSVVLDTRSSLLNGVLNRIDPRVEAGMVKVDVKITDALPREARPDLNLEGRIIVSQIDDALFVRRPAFSPRNTNVKLYRLTNDENFLSQQWVQLGISSVNHIQVIDGLKVGDRIVTSETSEIQAHRKVMLN